MLRGLGWVVLLGAGAAVAQDTAHDNLRFASVIMGHPVAGQERKAPVAGPPVIVTHEKTMTKEQAAALFKSVDEIMAFAATDTALPGVPHVKRRLVTREEVNLYLRKSFEEDESAKRLQRSEIVLKKFGLLNRDFDLRPFLIQLLTEQVAGYYDDKTKTVNMLNWVEPDEQKPVLAHELTHAIQDQAVGLEKWGSNGFHGESKTASEDNDRVRTDELETARQAVAEGEAMVVFVDYGLQGTGKTLKDSPEIGDRMKAAAADSSSSPVMSRAPLLLQRSLVFPYADGLAFEQALLIAGGKKQAFADALAAPPSSSFEVMNPAKYLQHAVVPVLRMPDVHPLLDADWEPYDLGVMGELDVEMMASLFGGAEAAKALAPAWDGGIYYAAQQRTSPNKAKAASLGVFYFSKWKTPDKALAFARVYEAGLARKYSKLTERKQDAASINERVYSTPEGDVYMSLDGRGLFISEGFSLATGRRIRASVLDAQGSGPVRFALAPALPPRHELTLSTVHALADRGMMKFALQK